MEICNDNMVRVPTESILWKLGKVTAEYNHHIKSPVFVILSLPLVLSYQKENVIQWEFTDH